MALGGSACLDACWSIWDMFMFASLYCFSSISLPLISLHPIEGCFSTGA